MLEERVQEMLQEVSFHVLLLCVSASLSREGYSDVQLLGRRTTKQKSYLGGCDLVAHQPLGVFHTRTLVKVIQDDVRLRMLDEMTGAMPRNKANFGVIVTPYGVTRQVRELNAEFPGHPIRIIDGKELSYLMVLHGIGVEDREGKGSIDYNYFQHLHEHSRKLLKMIRHMERGSY